MRAGGQRLLGHDARYREDTDYHRRAFLGYVQRRVGDRDIAEEIVQAALVKSLDKLDTVRETAVGWFYRVLHNAIVDHMRRGKAAERRIETLATMSESDAHDDELHAVVCTCISAVAETLSPAYADAIRTIELEGMTVKDYARKVGISSNNAGVRVFRAREALRRQVVRACGGCAADGCVDCTCHAPQERARTQ